MARAVSKESRCQHPKSMTRGVCLRAHIGEFDIPPDYKPAIRHLGQPDIPRPRARLCQQHKVIVEAFANGLDVNGHAHESQCLACRHPECARVFKQWVEWALDTKDVLAALDIGHRTFSNHVDHYGLWDKKIAKVNTKRALALAAERGFASGRGHSVRTALQSLSQLSKERGDVEEVRHTVTGVIGTVDITKLSKEQLAEMAEKLAEELRKGEGGGTGKALSSGEHQTIDLPASAVKVSTN